MLSGAVPFDPPPHPKDSKAALSTRADNGCVSRRLTIRLARAVCVPLSYLT